MSVLALRRPLSRWLYSASAEAVSGDLCRPAYEGGAVGTINKSDRNDARGIAQMMRVGLYRPVT